MKLNFFSLFKDCRFLIGFSSIFFNFNDHTKKKVRNDLGLTGISSADFDIELLFSAIAVSESEMSKSRSKKTGMTQVFPK